MLRGKFIIMALIAAALCLAGCASEEPEAGDVIDDIAIVDGSADGVGFPTIEAELGDSFEGLYVEALTPSEQRDREELPRGIKLFSLSLEAGDSVAAVMRRDGTGNLDPYLLLKDPNKETIAKGVDQAALITADEHDSVITWTAETTGTYLIFATSRHMDLSGGFTFDVVELTNLPPDFNMGLTDGTVRNPASELRGLRPRVEELVVEGLFIEGDDGFFYEGERPDDMGLEELREIRVVLQAVNRHRYNLVDGFIRINDGDVMDASETMPVFLELWHELEPLPE